MSVVCDIESLLHAIEGPITGDQADPNISSTRPFQLHEAMSVAAYVVTSLPEGTLVGFEKPFVYRGPNAARKLLDYLEKVNLTVQALYERNEVMRPLTPQEFDVHRNANCCFICDKPFAWQNVKVHDHCHITGMYRGAAHANCNINYKRPSYVPVCFHNLSG